MDTNWSTDIIQTEQSWLSTDQINHVLDKMNKLRVQQAIDSGHILCSVV